MCISWDTPSTSQDYAKLDLRGLNGFAWVRPTKGFLRNFSSKYSHFSFKRIHSICFTLVCHCFGADIGNPLIRLYQCRFYYRTSFMRHLQNAAVKTPFRAHNGNLPRLKERQLHFIPIKFIKKSAHRGVIKQHERNENRYFKHKTTQTTRVYLLLVIRKTSL